MASNMRRENDLVTSEDAKPFRQQLWKETLDILAVKAPEVRAIATKSVV